MSPEQGALVTFRDGSSANRKLSRNGLSGDQRMISSNATSGQADLFELPEEEKYWQSTPLNYLEKIFQIPFTLRPINRRGFGRIVDSFATPPKEAAFSSILRSRSSATERTSKPSTPGAPTEGSTGVLTDPRTPSAVTPSGAADATTDRSEAIFASAFSQSSHRPQPGSSADTRIGEEIYEGTS